ncbi:MAG TPA: hypothetical protein VKR06_32570 [Ktedonosporobacter sp.]|nr:hypothetical protein [Ktedonosporobacter sp.]
MNDPSLLAVQEIKHAHQLLFAPGQVVEVRALEASMGGSRPATYSGYFDNAQALITALGSLTSAKGIYWGIQQCHPDLLHRVHNKLVSAKHTTSDHEIVRYRWLPIDCDVRRLADISSTNQEHSTSGARARHIRELLRARGWPDPIFASSGNGAHLLYRIDLPVEDRDLVKRVLEALSAEVSDTLVQVDTSVHNPSRIFKCYGTRVCKGDNTPERPHRLARLVEVPETIQVVSREQLEALATTAGVVREEPRRNHATLSTASRNEQSRVPDKNKQSTRDDQRPSDPFDLAAFLKKHNIEHNGGESYQGGTRYRLTCCVWNESHTDKSACVFQFADGRLGASCSHNSCQGKGWQEFRLVFEPDAYDVNRAGMTCGPREQHDGRASQGAPRGNGADKEGEREKPVEQLFEIAQTVHTIQAQDGLLYGQLPASTSQGNRVGGTLIPLSEKGVLRHWLTNRYREYYGKLAPREALTQAIEVFIAYAYEHAERAQVHLRIAYQDGFIYLDLCNEAGQCVEITPNGWQVLDEAPVYFQRTNDMLALPVPEPGGRLDDLRQIINVKDDKSFMLMVAWLLSCFHPSGPYPHLNIRGEQGSGKSSATVRLRQLIDPHNTSTRSLPDKEEDVLIAAMRSRVLAFDNLSRVSQAMSDVFCRLSTGGGLGKRKLYEDVEEITINVKRAVIFNGIEEGLIKQSDLLNRTMLVTLERIEAYRTERELDELFADLHPLLLGVLCGAVSTALRDYQEIKLPNPPRMADCATWVTAAEPALGWIPGAFMTIYQENQIEGALQVIENSPLARAILEFMSDRDLWKGTAAELLAELQPLFPTNDPKVPTSETSLGRQLNKKMASDLSMQGIKVERDRDGKKRILLLQRVTPPQPPEGGTEGNDGSPPSTPTCHSPTVTTTPRTANGDCRSVISDGCSVTRDNCCNGPVTTSTQATGQSRQISDRCDRLFSSVNEKEKKKENCLENRELEKEGSFPSHLSQPSQISQPPALNTHPGSQPTSERASSGADEQGAQLEGQRAGNEAGETHPQAQPVVQQPLLVSVAPTPAQQHSYSFAPELREEARIFKLFADSVYKQPAGNLLWMPGEENTDLLPIPAYLDRAYSYLTCSDPTYRRIGLILLKGRLEMFGVPYNDTNC